MTEYLRIDIESTCIQQLERCAEHISASMSDSSRLLDAVRCAHLSALAAMIGALVGPAGVGAYPEKLSRKHLSYLRERDERPDLDYPEERTLTFTEALTAIQTPARLEHGATVVLDESETALAINLDNFRKLIDHPKPTSWSVPKQDLLAAVRFAPLIVERLRPTYFQLSDHAQRIETASRIIEAT